MPASSRRAARALAIFAAAAAASAFAQFRLSPPTYAAPFDYGDTATPASVKALLSVLADDSMQGRGTGTAGGDRAAKFIAEQMKKIGLEPGGDSGYFQRVPLDLSSGRPQLAKSMAQFDSLPKEKRRMAVNVIGKVPGYRGILERLTRQATPAADSIVLVDAHYDHLGIGRPNASGDSIFNGADDDGSGTVAVLEIARALHADNPHRHTVYFVTTTGEEVGLLGTNWYIAHPAVPVNMMVANLEIEMIGRPDSLAGGPGKAWLTGYDRSTMGSMLKDMGLAVVADPRPTQCFFSRSDNKAFADAGVPAHTLSTFNLHNDYHQVTDELSKIDFVHMAAVVNIGIRAVQKLADGPAPQWLPGGRPPNAADTACGAGRARRGGD